MGHQERISEIFIGLADTLVVGYDLIDFLQQLAERCVEVLDVTDAGIALVHDNTLQVLASSSDRMRLLELFEVQRNDGPCMDAWNTGAGVAVAELGEADDRWPVFAPAAAAAGYHSAYACPMRLRTTVIGALNLFADRPDGLDVEGQALAQAMADMATIGIMHERTSREQNIVADQLQAALTSRVLIEQAKGVLAEQGGLEIADAFIAMRTYARNANQRLTDVASAIVERRLTADQIKQASSSRGQRSRTSAR